MRNWFWCVSRYRLGCAGSPQVQQPSTPLAEPPGGSRGTAEVPPLSCGSGSDTQGPSVPLQEAAGGQRLRHLGLRRWRGWMPIPAAFCGNRKGQRALERSSTVGQQRAGAFLIGCKVSLRWGAKCLAMAAALGCACQLPLQGCRELPHVPMPHHPQGINLLYLLCLWEYLLRMGAGSFHLGHGNKGEQADLGPHGPPFPLPARGTRKPSGRCLLQLLGQGTLCGFSAAVQRGSPWQAPSPALGVAEAGAATGGRGTNPRSRDGGWQLLARCYSI